MSVLKRVNTNLVGKLKLPNSITSIGDSAFGGCSSLTSITIPNSVTSIGYNAFYDCFSLTSITIPDGVTSIYSYVFYNCSSLTSITIPNSVTSISYNAFCNCSSLISITIPNSVTSISNGAFKNLPSMPMGKYVYEGKYYENGVLSTGFYNNKYYKNGELFTGIYENKYYQNGELFNGIYNNKYYENGELFTGTKNGIEYIDGVRQLTIYAEYSGDGFSCSDIPNVTDYNTAYTIIKFTPDTSQEYYFNRSGGDTVISIKTDINDIQIGAYDADDEEYNTYLAGGTTYYIGIASYNGTGTCSLEVGPYSSGSSSSSSQIYDTGEYYSGTSFSTTQYCEKDYNKKYNVITFVPSQSGNYTFKNDGSYEMVIDVESDLYYISCGGYDYDLYEGQETSVYLNADNIYYIAIAPYYSSDSGDIILSVSLSE